MLNYLEYSLLNNRFIMKTKAFILSKYLLDLLQEKPKEFHLAVAFTFFVPLFLTFYILEWNFQILVFPCFGYITTFIGFHFSNEAAYIGNSVQNFRKHHRLIAENLNDVVIVHRLKDGNNEYVNAVSKTILGYFQKDLIGQSTIFMIHPADRKKVKNILSNLASLDNYFYVETVRVRCKNGAFKWMELNVKSLKNEFGKRTFAIFTFRDISKTIELEKASKQFAEELFTKYMNIKNVGDSKPLPAVPSNA